MSHTVPYKQKKKGVAHKNEQKSSKLLLLRSPHLSPVHLKKLQSMRMMGTLLPQSHFATVYTNGVVSSLLDATVGVTGRLVVNSLLNTASNWTASGQGSYLAPVASFYQNYRVHGFQVEVEAIGRQTLARSSVLQTVPMASNPAYGTGTVDYGIGCMRLSRVDTVGSTLQSPDIIRFKTPLWKISDIVPDLESRADSDYTGTISSAGVFASPSNSVDFVWFFSQTSGLAYTAGEVPDLRMRLLQVVEFFDVRPA